MSAPPADDPGIPVENKQQLVDFIASGCKPPEKWRIGTEHEKFAFDIKTLRPLPYEGTPGIRALLEGLMRFGWKPHLENGKPIALSMDGQSITLEPGGQFELSGAPLSTMHEICEETYEWLATLRRFPVQPRREIEDGTI